ncbi:MAG: gamma carbonic anhydrase family protein [Elusimicrobia bacterium CG08_land_8_20_14_0_20_51_18]|nr:MAG: gamma carbonic anhydrase family protein [Elusimicrobia bacterium CG08_land_8_20_14_0_20_51_18]
MISDFSGFSPEIAEGAYVHPSAQIIGRVKIETEVSVWPCAVIRGDVEAITVKKGSNVQDCAVLHPNRNKPVILDEGVTVGHSAVVHGSVIGRNCLIGMGAVVMDSEVGEFSLIGAGCVVTPDSKIPPRSLVLGLPFRIVRTLNDSEVEALKKSEADYAELMKMYDKGR